jgi:N-acetylated-alpha-linked acidic dipeptidase
MGRARGRWALVTGTTAAALAVGVAPAAHGAAGAGSGAAASAAALPGYTASSSVRQRAYERRFRRAVDVDSIQANSRALARFNRRDGTPGDRRGYRRSLRLLRSYGLRAHGESYDVYLSSPKQVEVTMTAPAVRPLATIERNGFPWQTDTRNIVVGSNAYSPSGDVTAPVVYANYGRPEDFATLERRGIDVAGKIVLVRYGQNFRGVKARQAELRRAAGVVIYSDPEDDGFVRGKVYPDGPFRPADAIQRGSIQYLFAYPGDPLTPGRPSVPGTPRLRPEDAANLPRIPTTPISYSEAEPLLRALGGPQAPKDFQGGLGFPYHLGPGPTAVHLRLAIDYARKPIRDAFAVIRGAKHPRQLVIVGAHQDAWTYGANDDLSGWTSVLEIAKRLGRLQAQGWRPDRTIVLAGWDGEEYGLLGSTEWTEQHEAQLRGRAVAYLNVDITAGKTFGAGAVPALDDLLFDVTRAVRDPGTKQSVFASWKGDAKAPTVDRLGSGSDYTGPLDHVGVPALEIGFTSPSGEYHSAYDDTYQLEHFLDPGYVHHAAAARILGSAALRLADADVVPLRYSVYARELLRYVRRLERASRRSGAARVDLAPLTQAARDWRAATRRLEARGRALVRQSLDTRAAQRELARINRALHWQERRLITPAGLPGRPWFRHQVYAPGIVTGYAAQELPGMRDAVEAGDEATARRYRDRLVASLRRAIADARGA